MNKKIILFDVDGTLVDCVHGIDYINEETQKALHKLKEAGHYIFIASGRPYCYLLDELLKFDFDGYILNDGAQIIFHDQQLAIHPIEKKFLLDMIDQVKKKGSTFVAYSKKYAYFYNDDGFLVDYAKTFKFNDKYLINVDNIEDYLDEAMKVHVLSKNKADHDEFDLDMNEFFCFNDKRVYLKEIFSKKYTKATALKEILDIVNIDVEETYFFGDGFNDIEMMDFVGHPIAMGNSHEDVKKHAEYICKNIEDDGVADFINNSDLFFI